MFTIFRVGFLMSARVGMGVVVAKLPNGEWSPPSSIGIGGLGGGFNAGAEMVDFLIVLNSRAAVRSFMTAGSLQLGGNLSLAVGPLGRTGEASAAMNSEMQLSAMFSYSVSRGLYGGVTIEGTVLIERKEANEKVYGGSVTPMQILSGSVEVPQFAVPLISRIEEVTGSVPFNDDESSTTEGLDSNENFDGSTYTGTRRPTFFEPQHSKSIATSYRTHDMPRAPMDDLDEQLQSNSLRGKNPSPPPPRQHVPYVPPVARGPTQRQSASKVEPMARGLHHATSYDSNAPEDPFSDIHAIEENAANAPDYSRLSYQPRVSRRAVMRDDEFDSMKKSNNRPVDEREIKTQRSHPVNLIDPSILDGDLVVAIHEFTALRDTDLSFKRGDLIRVTRRTNKDNDWWTGELVATYRDGPPPSGEYVFKHAANHAVFHPITQSHSK